SEFGSSPCSKTRWLSFVPSNSKISVKLFASNACRTFSIWLRAYGLISSSIESSGACSSRVTRIEFEVAGEVTKADHDRTTEGVCLTISHQRPNRPQHFSLVLGLHARSGQDDVRIEMPGNFIRHDLECALRLGLVERQTKLIEAMRPDLPAMNPALRLFDQRRFFLFSQRNVLLLFRPFCDPLRVQSLRLPG